MLDHKLLEVHNLKKYYPVTGGLFSQHLGDVRAVDDVSFDIKEGEALGLVGESGCGKSTLGRTILRLEEPTEGQIIYRKTDITRLNQRELRGLRQEMQMIFQDPQSFLDPRMTVGQSIGEALLIHGVRDDKEREQRVIEILERVGLEGQQGLRYPHEFSSGQRQRIGIGRALILNPKLIIADEPVSALDVSIQAQILNLMLDLREEFGLTYLFIAHDLSVIKYVSQRVAVMYLGKIVELASRDEIFQNTRHPYTEALLSAIPGITQKKKTRIILPGSVPSPINPPAGCRFHTRCHRVLPLCHQEEPNLRDIGNEHLVACHLYRG
ncbi:MAG: dipeptide ABC transporter ATP-binding protein [Chloroflexi bacterium]|nr:dipeptide ABC transporter ATP-binding protein [Chloroflexota bacterium]MBI3041023.1 dipeptide ABC transporter ATP-binding protein [Chloroflexota bacterium]MBI3931356.1 dipeptide ABC transporter ATP-binding protein [Chloroflexota bacterium]